jgi:hypothetical protein
VLAVGVTLAVVAGLLYGLGRLGDEARRRVGPRERYTVRFADIECDTPPGLDRPKFLAEVRYVGKLPETFNVIAEDATERLTAGFAAHPWVKAVEGIDIDPQARVRVRLRFRVPVLAIRILHSDVPVLVADDFVALPLSPVPPGVTEYGGQWHDPRPSPGEVWKDENVRRAVELAIAYHPMRLDMTLEGWRLTMPDGKVLVIGP